ncbi:hypothetical protein SEA_MCGEE_1 [Mycobacterium phage McGee]|nr:hypothetical protein SEA_DIETRICK_1 [Mycobacterium phage Dietrick]QAY11037.1 hypothetical protein SEA_NAPOLEON13_1 [Mycobacterium phage Napoleon13]URP21304.1 hypothetical protein SEA_MCGEE_1 [Mycobacterium phage McGee]WNO26887.1 hypothetical protein SEA_SRISHMEG2525_1 [Mycobacterium phage SrishMeg2525]
MSYEPPVRVEIPSELLPLIHLVAEHHGVSPQTVAVAWMTHGAENACTEDDIRDMAAKQGERIHAGFQRFLKDHLVGNRKNWLGGR